MLRIDVPHDRQVCFGWQFVLKVRAAFAEPNDKTVALCAHVKEVHEIRVCFTDQHGTEVWLASISSETDAVMAEVIA
jgi:hypothetical protein